MDLLNRVWHTAVRRRTLLLLVGLTVLVGFSLVEQPAELSSEPAEPVAGPGYLVGRVIQEGGESASGAELFFKVQKAFGASCYSRECDSFQKAIFKERLTVPTDGGFEIQIPEEYMNTAKAPRAYVYTVVVRTTEGKFRPFYAFKLDRQKSIVNDFVLKPPFMDTAPGGEDEIDAS